MRNNLFVRVPPTFIVDDFFITLSVLNQHKQGLFNPAALCREDVSSDMGGEYRRKVRISSGNFQNLFHFRKNLLRFWTALGFSFWSHKVLRWLTPFLLITALLSAGLLANTHRFFMAVFLIQLVGFLSPLLNKAFSFKLHGLKFVSHFYLMNFALLEGFIKYAKGIKTSIWQPVKRNV